MFFKIQTIPSLQLCCRNYTEALCSFYVIKIMLLIESNKLSFMRGKNAIATVNTL